MSAVKSSIEKTSKSREVIWTVVAVNLIKRVTQKNKLVTRVTNLSPSVKTRAKILLRLIAQLTLLIDLCPTKIMRNRLNKFIVKMTHHSNPIGTYSMN